MRWLILTDDYPPLDGGVATWTRGAAMGLAARGHRVTVLCRHRPGLPNDPGVVLHGVRGPSFGRRGAGYLAIRAAPLLPSIDAVLASTWTVATAIAPMLRAMSIPLHVVAHGSDLTRATRYPAKRSRVLRQARCWAVSQFLVGEAKKLGVVASWIPSPIEVSASVANPRGPWGVVARATSLKGVDRVIRIVAAAEVEAVVVGGGPVLPGWRQLSAELGASVKFVGTVSRESVSHHRERWALSMLTPRTHPDGTGAEGLGLALLESISQGVPAVGCTTGGVPEAVSPHGLVLTDPDDAMASVVEIRAWLSSEVGQLSQDWLGETHGRAAVAKALCS